MPALLTRMWSPPSSLSRVGHEPLDGHGVADVALGGVDLHPHRAERGLGQERLLGHVAARQVHEAERHVAAQPPELERDGAAEPGGAAGDDRHLAPEPGLGGRPAAAARARRPSSGGPRPPASGRPCTRGEGWHRPTKVRRGMGEGKRFARRGTGRRPSYGPCIRNSLWILIVGRRRRRLGGPRAAPGRDDQRRLAGARRRRHLPRRAIASTPVPRHPGARSSTPGAPPPPSGSSNGRDFVPTTRWVLFGHHFAAIAGAGPLVGPVLAAQFGYLPGHHLDRLRRGARRRGAGLRHPLRLDAPRRQVARPDGQGGDRPGHRAARR